jgi:SAM-dependent methyltransferase
MNIKTKETYMIKFKLLIVLLLFAFKANHAMELITTFYPESSSERLGEYYHCLSKNLAHPLILNIHILYENQPKKLDPIFSHPKIKIIPINTRPSFAQIFKYANQFLVGKKTILANTDIFFDNSLFKLNYFPMANKFMCLTRYNLPTYTGKWNRHIESHDSWIFQAPINISIPDEIKLGTHGCDLILQRIACTTPGLEVSNPSLDIKSYHAHANDERNYSSSHRQDLDKYPRIKLPFSNLQLPNLSWGLVQSSAKIMLYAGNMQDAHPSYGKFACISLDKNNATHLLYDARHRIPLADNCVDVYQSEDVFEHIGYHYLDKIVNEIYRVLKPGGFCRISLPDYRCDILYDRSLKDEHGKILFDPQGGGKYVNGKVIDGGHLWFPKFELVRKSLEKTLFYTNGKVEFLHYYDTMGRSITKPIDYSVCHVKRTPDHDARVQNPYRAMSLVVDLFKS